MNDDLTPATKGDLRAGLEELESRMNSRFENVDRQFEDMKALMTRSFQLLDEAFRDDLLRVTHDRFEVLSDGLNKLRQRVTVLERKAGIA